MSNMKEILGQAKNVRRLLDQKYAVDYYQREYTWKTKQVPEPIDDLAVQQVWIRDQLLCQAGP